MVAPLKRVGLFGGSFNPAHEGHLYITDMALSHLGLDEVWWLISPKNPLKDKATLAPYAERLEAAQKITAGKPIRVVEVEKENNLRYTIDTIRHLKENHEDFAFAWVMGADCFKDLHTWKSWREIMAEMPVAVFPRPGFTDAALSGTAATEFKKNRIPDSDAKNLVVTNPLAWVYIDCEPMATSGTEIRRRKQG